MTAALHVVQVGWDTTLLDERAASDSRERQVLYARLLDERRPGSRMTIVVLGASRASRPLAIGSLTVLPLPGRWAGLARLSACLSRLDRATPVSVIAAQSPLEDGWACLGYARGRIPVVVQVHLDLLADAALPGGSRLKEMAGALRRRMALALLPRYAMVRVVARRMVEPLVALGARNVRVAPVAIPDLTRLAAAAGPRHEPRVLFVGRLAPEKNLDLWLEVARRVRAKVPAARFDIVGDGAARERLTARTESLRLGEAVTFHGGQTRDGLPVHFGRAAVLLLTSDHEGFGRVLVEAMAAGAAVVSTRTGGAAEVIGDSGAGFLADVGDADGLAHAVIALLTDEALRTRTVKAAAEHIGGRYDPLRLAGAWVDMLIEAAERPLSLQQIASPGRSWPAS